MVKMRAGCVGKPFLCGLARVSPVPAGSPDMKFWEAEHQGLPAFMPLMPFPTFGSGVIAFQDLTDVNVDPIVLCDPEQVGVTSEPVFETMSWKAIPTLRT